MKIYFIKKVKILTLILLVFTIGFFSINMKKIYASSNATENNMKLLSDFLDEKVENKSTFFDNNIERIEYLYSIDESQDFVLVEFQNKGYVIFAKDTMEMMEYSLDVISPYQNIIEKKYYVGPTNYLTLSNVGKFYNIINKEQFEISREKTRLISQKIREDIILNVQRENILINNEQEMFIKKIFNQSVDKKDPEIGDGLIKPENTGKLISNYNYFLSNPTHGNNYNNEVYGNGNSGTCGPVAAQLLLGYNNYYNDRKIISDKFLNGYSDSLSRVTNLEFNPNYSSNPRSLTRQTTGTRSENTGNNSFYAHIIEKIMKPNTSGSTVKQVENGIKAYLDENIGKSSYEIESKQKGWFFGWSPIDSAKIKSEINSNRPIIIGTSSNLGGHDHFVVGYGYENYTYPSGEGTYSGYIVHYGWSGQYNTWINESWADSYISVKTNHNHNYSIDTGINYGTTKRIFKCVCGDRELINIHTYTYKWFNLRQHHQICSCGDVILRGHLVSSDWNGIGRTNCLQCGGEAELGFVIQNINYSANLEFHKHVNIYFGDGSCIMTNGLIVLSRSDLKRYYENNLEIPNV